MDIQQQVFPVVPDARVLNGFESERPTIHCYAQLLQLLIDRFFGVQEEVPVLKGWMVRAAQLHTQNFKPKQVMCKRSQSGMQRVTYPTSVGALNKIVRIYGHSKTHS